MQPQSRKIGALRCGAEAFPLWHGLALGLGAEAFRFDPSELGRQEVHRRSQRSLAPMWFRKGCTGRLRRFGSVIALPLFVAEPHPNALPLITLGAARIHNIGWSGFSLFCTLGFCGRRHARHNISIRRHALALRTIASSALAHHHGRFLFLGTHTFRTRQRRSGM